MMFVAPLKLLSRPHTLPIALLCVALSGCVIEPFSAPIALPHNPVAASYSPDPAWNSVHSQPVTGVLIPTTEATTTTTQPLATSPVTIDLASRDQIGRVARELILKKYPAARDAALNDYVMLVGSLVTIASPAAEADNQFILVESDRPMSGAVGPKTVFISRGMLNAMNDESELAGVLARELSNLLANRPLKAIGYLVTEPAGKGATPLPRSKPVVSPSTKPAATQPAAAKVASATGPTTRPAIAEGPAGTVAGAIATTQTATSAPALPATPPVALAEPAIRLAAQKLADIVLKEGMGADLEQVADLEGARLAAAAKYSPDGYLHLLTRLRPGAANSPEWLRIKTLDANVALIAKASPGADLKLPARFESYVKPR